MKKIIVAKVSGKDGNSYAGKREAKMYDEKDSSNAQLIDDANIGLTLRVQRSIRDAVKVNHGLKEVSTGGESVDLSDIEAV